MAVVEDFDEDLRIALAAVEDQLEVGGHRNLVTSPVIPHLFRIINDRTEIVQAHIGDQRQHFMNIMPPSYAFLTPTRAQSPLYAPPAVPYWK